MIARISLSTISIDFNIGFNIDIDTEIDTEIDIDSENDFENDFNTEINFSSARDTPTTALEVVRLDGTANVAVVVSIVDLHKVSVNDRLNRPRGWSNKVIIVSAFLLSVCVCSEGCSSTPFGSTETKTFEWPSNEKLDWLNPSRCIDPCEKQPSDMIEVGAMGKAQPGSGHRVRRFVQPALEALFKAAGRAGHKIQIISAFRDYNEQIEFWHRFENEPGRVALPGHSEHQLGTTVDLDTSAAGEIWFVNNAHTYGFTLSYPDAKQRITGFREEPWHLRFVGQNLAQQLFEKHWCLEEYFRQNATAAAPSGDCTKCSSPLSRRACGDISSSGLCRGDVMTWCFDGTLAAVDCTTSNRTCSTKNGQPSCEFSK